MESKIFACECRFSGNEEEDKLFLTFQEKQTFSNSFLFINSFTPWCLPNSKVGTENNCMSMPIKILPLTFWRYILTLCACFWFIDTNISNIECRAKGNSRWYYRQNYELEKIHIPSKIIINGIHNNSDIKYKKIYKRRSNKRKLKIRTSWQISLSSLANEIGIVSKHLKSNHRHG